MYYDYLDVLEQYVLPSDVCLSFLSTVLPYSLFLKIKTEIVLNSDGDQFDHLKQALNLF